MGCGTPTAAATTSQLECWKPSTPRICVTSSSGNPRLFGVHPGNPGSYRCEKCGATRVVKLKRTMWSSGATLLALLLVFVRPALGDPCVLTVGSLYQLKSDAVDWTMQTSSGQSCIRGLRHKRVTIDTAKLISPPQSGQVKLLGPGFSYTAKSDFEGQDSFTIQVSGMLNGIRGSSDIRIIVSVGPDVSPQTRPTERSDRPPGDVSSAGQPNHNSTARGTNQTRTNQTRQVTPAVNAASDGLPVA